MSEPRADLVGREVAALKGLERLVAGRSELEAKIERENHARRAAVEKTFIDTRSALDARSKAEEAEIERRAREEPARLRAEFEATSAEAARVRDAARAAARKTGQEETESAKKKLSEARWEAGTICEAALNENKTHAEHQLNRLADVEKRVRQSRADAVAYLKSRRLAGLAAALEEEQGSEPTEASPADVEASESAADAIDEATDRLRRLFLARLTGGWAPLALLLLPAIGLGLAAYFTREQSVNQAIVGASAGLVAGIILLVAAAIGARAQARKALGPIREGSSLASRTARAARAEVTATQQQRENELLSRRDREHAAADDRARKAVGRARMAHDEAVSMADAQHEEIVSKATERRDSAIRTIEEETARALPASREKHRLGVAEATRKHEADRAEADRLHDAAKKDLAARWRSGLGHVRDELGFVGAETDRCCPPFEEHDFAASEAPKVVPPAIRIGGLSVDLSMFPGGAPADPSLMDGLPSSFTPPALLAAPDGCSLLIETAAEGRDQAIKTLQATMLRLLTSFPPGKVRFTIIDPVGLGANFSAFMHLADFDEQLVTSRIWTEAQHIEQRLVDLTEHMENVIQKYLRNEYRSIMEYNAKAGEVAEPFRFLVVADFPVRFNEAASRRLLSIAASGARCGVFTLMSVDTRQELPQGVDLKDLEKHASVLAWKEGKLRWRDPGLGGFPLALDEPPRPEVFTTIVQAIGQKAHGASRVEVPFEFIAPAEGQFWTKDSRSGLDVPLGRAGATKTQNLKLGQGTSQHVVIAGKTGSGKSTLLHILITNTALNYSPDEVELYLIDFKKGVEFKTYATHRLPHARVIAVESEREFGLSVLQRLDAELKERGDRYRKVGAQDVASFRAACPNEPMPRILLIVDEFQEFFVDDDKIGQEASLLLDRLVRQGRAFGIHVHLGSQTLAGAYTLARATIGQMAVRIALQSNEADASLILSDENTAARLLSRPGEAIYNDANGRVEGNNFFQVVWLRDELKDRYLERIHQMAEERGLRARSQIIFEGNIPPDPFQCSPLRKLLDTPSWPSPAPKVETAWLGEPVAIKEPTSMVFRRQGGSHLLIVGQNDEAAVGLACLSMIGLAAHGPEVSLTVLDGTPADASTAGTLERVARRLPQKPKVVGPALASKAVEEVALELQRRQDESITDAPPVFLIVFDLQRFRDLRKAEDDYGFSSRSPDEPVPASERFATILRDGPLFGVHTVLWCDSLNNLNRSLDRAALRELETRVLFQMSAGDSSTLIDSPAANRLGNQRALLVNEVQGIQEKFRPFSPPSSAFLDLVAKSFAGRPTPEPAGAREPGEGL